MPSILQDALLLSLGINLLMFLVAFTLKSDKLTDISYAVTFITLTLMAYLRGEAEFGRTLLAFMIVAWGVRIGGFLLYRVMKKGKDRRFDDMRASFFRFGKFWLGQAITVWILMLPALLALQGSIDTSWLAAAGFTVWAIGLIIEAVADYQKYSFSLKPANKNKWIDTGIWRYSRHPNYFGEILVWIGVYLFVLDSLNSLQALLGLLSPIVIIILLLFVSGIPILEKNADRKWGEMESYKKYKKRTSILIPVPNSKG